MADAMEGSPRDGRRGRAKEATSVVVFRHGDGGQCNPAVCFIAPPVTQPLELSCVCVSLELPFSSKELLL
jgi:hypothetical protein